MKRFLTIWSTLVLSTGILQEAGAQDLHFSQFFNSPLSTNPANTGFIPDGDYRIGINYRNQWSSIMSVPYKTMSAFGDVQVGKDRFQNGWIGLGGMVLKDVAGSGNLTSTKVYGSVAYHQMLGYSSLISAGFNVGYASKRIDVAALKFPDQFDGHFFDNKLPTSAFLDRTSVGYLDLQAGMNFAYFPTSNIYLNGGFSVGHINRPRESFFNSDANDVDNRIPMRNTAFLNGSIKINDQWIINPNFYFTSQAGAFEGVGGFNAHYNLSGDGGQVLVGGLYYRYKEALIPMIGIGLNDYVFSFSYDITMSPLKAYNNSRGALEFSLVKQGVFEKYSFNRRQTICPSFKN
ncbi:MAG: type IX secretion system membrane protein PorP/SprF [Chitinophagaceae bacterium]|nr:MAG: type IX secretion system membrane protein PorP/SprF [Chitinophagaceae bacterium]